MGELVVLFFLPFDLIAYILPWLNTGLMGYAIPGTTDSQTWNSPNDHLSPKVCFEAPLISLVRLHAYGYIWIDAIWPCGVGLSHSDKFESDAIRRGALASDLHGDCSPFTNIVIDHLTW